MSEPLIFYVWIVPGIAKGYRTFPCGHYHQRPVTFRVDAVCYCVADPGQP